MDSKEYRQDHQEHLDHQGHFECNQEWSGNERYERSTHKQKFGRHNESMSDIFSLSDP